MSDLLVAFEEYLKVTKALESNSICSYLSDISQLQKDSHKPLLSLESSDILLYLSKYENKRTLNRKLSVINSFYSFCHTQFSSEKKLNIPMSKVHKKLPKYLTIGEIMAGLATIDRSSLIGLRDYALILFLYASGCRISEALSAQRSDIVDGWLKIRYAKGQKERIVPIATIAIDALQEYQQASGIHSSHLWLNYRGGVLSRISAYKIVMRYLGVSPHVLRHSFASGLILGGADLRVVQELLGHSSLITTQIYTHIEPKELADTLSKYHPLRGEY